VGLEAESHKSDQFLELALQDLADGAFGYLSKRNAFLDLTFEFLDPFLKSLIFLLKLKAFLA
jgi:hypothetical protein